jgi:hypothetical protein
VLLLISAGLALARRALAGRALTLGRGATALLPLRLLTVFMTIFLTIFLAVLSAGRFVSPSAFRSPRLIAVAPSLIDGLILSLSDGLVLLGLAALALSPVDLSFALSFTLSFGLALGSTGSPQALASSLALSLALHSLFMLGPGRTPGHFACRGAACGRAGRHSMFATSAHASHSSAGSRAFAHTLGRRQADACQQRSGSQQKLASNDPAFHH